eukprot:3818439-Lingulodinium_polyedra.AAC.1
MPHQTSGRPAIFGYCQPAVFGQRPRGVRLQLSPVGWLPAAVARPCGRNFEAASSVRKQTVESPPS